VGRDRDDIGDEGELCTLLTATAVCRGRQARVFEVSTGTHEGTMTRARNPHTRFHHVCPPPPPPPSAYPDLVAHLLYTVAFQYASTASGPLDIAVMFPHSDAKSLAVARACTLGDPTNAAQETQCSSVTARIVAIATERDHQCERERPDRA